MLMQLHFFLWAHIDRDEGHIRAAVKFPLKTPGIAVEGEIVPVEDERLLLCSHFYPPIPLRLIITSDLTTLPELSPRSPATSPTDPYSGCDALFSPAVHRSSGRGAPAPRDS